MRRNFLIINGVKIINQDTASVLEQFLEFLAEDIRQSSQQIRAVDSKLIDRLHALTADVQVDLDEPLLDEDE